MKIVYDLNFPPNLSDLAVLVEPLLIVRGAIREQLAQVHAEGCTEVQGYFFSALRPASEIPKLLSTLEKVKVAA